MVSRKNKPVRVLPDILRNTALQFPDKTALIASDARLSYKELYRAVIRLSRRLTGLGLKKGDRVGIFLEKSFEEIISLWAVAFAGGVFVSIDPRLFPDQVLYRVKDCSMSFLITSRRKSTVQGMAGAGVLFVEDLESGAVADPFIDEGPSDLSGSDLAALIYTSGSTGYPKGVMLEHKALVFGTITVADYLGNSDRDALLSLLPMSFDYGLNQMLTSCYAGGTLVLQKSSFANDICDTLIKEKVTGFAGIPTVWVMLLQENSYFRNLKFPHLRYITNSGGAIPSGYLDRLRKILPGVKIYLMYGLTEAFRSTYLPPEELERRPDSIGKAIPGVEIKVMNKDGKECLPGEEGMLVHSGGAVFRGYWNDPEATARILKPLSSTPEDRTLAVWSGDIVKKDEQGFLYFVSREDDIIKTLGHRISPQEIEDVIYRIEGVKEAVVVGVEDDLRGQAIKAVVSLTGVRSVGAADIAEFCRDNLPGFMAPCYVEIMDSLPKTSSGKIDRKALKGSAAGADLKKPEVDE